MREMEKAAKISPYKSPIQVAFINEVIPCAVLIVLEQEKMDTSQPV